MTEKRRKKGLCLAAFTVEEYLSIRSSDIKLEKTDTAFFYDWISWKILVESIALPVSEKKREIVAEEYSQRGTSKSAVTPHKLPPCCYVCPVQPNLKFSNRSSAGYFGTQVTDTLHPLSMTRAKRILLWINYNKKHYNNDLCNVFANADLSHANVSEIAASIKRVQFEGSSGFSEDSSLPRKQQ